MNAKKMSNHPEPLALATGSPRAAGKNRRMPPEASAYGSGDQHVGLTATAANFSSRGNWKDRKAILLIMVLLIVSGVSLTALAFSESMLVGFEESLLMGRSAQARAAADSGIAATRVFLANTKAAQKDAGGVWSNPTYFQAVNIVPDGDPQELCHFSIVAPSLDEDGRYSSIRFGLQNESARINLNALVVIDKELGTTAAAAAAITGSSSLGNLAGGSVPSDLTSSVGSASSSSTASLGRQLLMGLEGMTEEIADCILDYIDADEEVREFGAESEYYAGLQSPYKPANGPLQSVDELLLVKGVTPSLLYGMDQNRNGVIDSFEESQTGVSLAATDTTSLAGSSTSSNSSSGAVSQLGWAAYLTTISREKNIGFDGTARVNVNGTEIEQLKTDLETALGNDSWSSYILAYRMYGGTSASNDADLNALIGAGVIGGGNGPGGGNGNGRPGGDQNNGPGGGRDGGRGGRGGQDGGPGGNGNGPGGDGPNGGRGGGPDGGRGGPGGPGDGRGRSAELFLPQSSSGLVRLVALQGPTNGGEQGGGPRGGQGGDGPRGNGPGGDGPRGNGPGGDGPRGNGPGGDGPRGNGSGGRPGQGGGSGGMSGGGGANARPVPWNSDALQIQSGDQPKASLKQILDLVGSTVTIQRGNQSTTYSSPFADDPVSMALYMPILMDKLTTVSSPVIAGRININEAPREILAGLPGMTTELLDQIMEARAESSESENRRFETWPMVEGFITLSQMRMMQPLITGGGDIYRAQIVGYYEQGAAYSRIEAWIDSSDAKPKVIAYRRLDHLGRGFSNSTLGQRSVNNPLAAK